jgi:putative Mn2+ efflux pump MntP
MPLAVILLAFGLAADAFAVAVGQGVAAKAHAGRQALIVGAAFGAAQAVAPLLGWALTMLLAGVIEQVDHWIAFGLLAAIGGKMVWEGLRSDPPGTDSDPGKEQVAGGWTLFMLAVATSIDAAAAGMTLPTLGAPPWASAATIGLVTFVLSAAGVMIGRAGAKAVGPQAEIVGGLILVVIGAKVLIDHRAFG